MEGISSCTLRSQEQHAYSLKDLSNRAPSPLHYTNTVEHATNKTHIYINRATQKIQGYNITFTTTLVQEAVKQNKNTYSQVPDNSKSGTYNT